MFAKAAFGLALVLATASGAAAMKADSASLSHSGYTNVYNPLGAPVGSDPDLNIRFELNRDWGRGTE
jgi:hypothetical protein